MLILLGLLAFQASATPAAPVPKAYVGEFCGPIGLSDEGAGSLMQHLAQWDGHPASDTDAYAARPVDGDAPGQLFRFSDPAAPAAFIDRRRGVCTLVYSERPHAGRGEPGAFLGDPARQRQGSAVALA